MSFSQLSTLTPKDKLKTICVKVSRKWEFRGLNDDGPLQHVDLVLVDDQGNSIYAEIPASEAERHSATLEEGKIYIMRRFRVCNAKNYCKSLLGPYMLEITCHTRINLARETATFPEYGYFLTPFDEIPGYIGDKKKFHGSHLYYLNHKNQLEQLSRNNSICFMLMYLASLFKSMNQNGFILLTKQRLHCEGTLSLEMTSMWN